MKAICEVIIYEVPILPVNVQRVYYRSSGMDINQMSCVTIGVLDLSPAMVTLKNILERDVKNKYT